MAYSDLEASLGSIVGALVTVNLHNPTSQAESARVRLTVSLLTGGTQTITSLSLTVAAGATKQAAVLAIGPIDTVTDGPDTFPP